MFKIAYGAGHWLGNANGVPPYIGLGEIREWTLNHRVAEHFARAALEYEGVELLRLDDSTGQTAIELADRAAAANRWGADFAFEIHHNAGIRGGAGGGAVAYSYPGSQRGKAYRDAIYDAVITAGGLKGDRADPLQEKAWDILRLTNMPAVLMEYGFMDSKTDAPVIVTDSYSKLVAYATMEGIARVAGLKKKAVPEETSGEEQGYSLRFPYLREGSAGEAVRSLQQLLTAKGSPCSADGIFGPKTKQAVRQYQTAVGLGADGVVGQKTMARLWGGGAGE